MKIRIMRMFKIRMNKIIRKMIKKVKLKSIKSSFKYKVKNNQNKIRFKRRKIMITLRKRKNQ